MGMVEVDRDRMRAPRALIFVNIRTPKTLFTTNAQDGAFVRQVLYGSSRKCEV